MSKVPLSIPKLELGQIPKGIPGLSVVQPINARCQRVSSELSNRLEFMDTPKTDIITNCRPQLHTSRPEFSNYSMSWETTNAKTFRPPDQSPPKNLQRNGRDRWIRLDREVLRFFMYFKESVPESPLEHYRVRKCVLFYFLATDMIQITEPKVPNSGIPQGAFLQKIKISHFVNNKCEQLSLNDLLVGEELTIFGRTFHIVDCDEKTRKYFASELHITQSDAVEYPLDPLALKQRHEEEREGIAKGSVAGMRTKNTDTLWKFLKYGKQTLRISACWDDSNSAYGEKRYFNIIYHLCDDTIEINEKYTANCGRERFPKFLARTKVLKNDAPGEEEYYSAKDFILGTTIIINKRPFLLLRCDADTKAFYDEIGIKQVPVLEEKKQKVLPKMKPPPYNGFGSEEDSLGSFYNLVPKAPKQNYSKSYKYGTQALRIKVELITDAPQDKGRQFVIIFFLGDETLSIFEPPRRNTGIVGGKFLERRQYINELTGKHFVKEDFETAIKTDSLIRILKREYKVLSPDKFTKEFFGMKPKSEITKEKLNHFLVRVLHQGLKCQIDMRKALNEAANGSKTISLDGFKSILLKFGIEPSAAEDEAIIQNFHDTNSKSPDILYSDFCDELATLWSAQDRLKSGNQIDEIEIFLLNKLRMDSGTNIRKLFRKFDQDKNGVLTFSEFQSLLSHYNLNISPYEIAELMSRYDKDREGKIDYNKFCDKVYECDFANISGAKVIISDGESISADVYLKKLKAEEEHLKLQNHSDNLVVRFCDSFKQKRYELRKAFIMIDKSRDGKVSMEEFMQGCDEVHPLSDDDKYLLSKAFFPQGVDKIDYDTFMDSLFKFENENSAFRVS